MSARGVQKGPQPVIYGTTEGTAAEGNDARFSAIPSPSDATPSNLGAAGAGVSPDYSRRDHVHPMPSAAEVGAAETSHTHDAADISGLPSFVDNEEPDGTIGGGNLDFTLAHAPNPPDSLHLHRNGALQLAGYHFTLTGNAFTYRPDLSGEPGPVAGEDWHRASYRH